MSIVHYHEPHSGRVNQKLRTRRAILEAAAQMVEQGEAPTLAAAAARALVSVATAYRHFPDQETLLREAMASRWPDPAASLAAVADGSAGDRAAHAAEVLIRGVLANERAARSAMALSLLRSVEGDAAAASVRPGHRLGLIDEALRPFADRLDEARLLRLKRALAVVISAEALVSLKDICGCDEAEVLATVAWAARALVAAELPDGG